MDVINYLSYIIVQFCTEVTDLLNNDSKADPYKVACSFLCSNKDAMCLSGFYISEPDKKQDASFYIELYFNNYPDRVAVQFRKKKRDNVYQYIPSIKGRYIITNIVDAKLDGLLYINKKRNVLYVNQLTKETPIYDGERVIKCLGDKNKVLFFNEYFSSKDYIPQEAERLSQFIENNKNNINCVLIQNIDLNELDGDFEYPIMDELIDKYRIDAFVVSSVEVKNFINVVAGKYNIPILRYEDVVPLLDRKLWINKCANYLLKEYAFSLDKDELSNTVTFYRKDYSLSMEEFSELCSVLQIPTLDNSAVRLNLQLQRDSFGNFKVKRDYCYK